MLVSYEDYKNKYTDSQLSLEIFNEYNNVLHLYFYSEVVYTESQILRRFDIESIKNIFLYQLNYFENFGLYDDGIISQASSGVSQTINSKNTKGQINISSIFDAYLLPLRVLKI